MLKWDRSWTRAFIEGRHIDGRSSTQLVARVVALRQSSAVPIMPHPCGRERRLFLAMANRGQGCEAVGVYGTAKKAKHEVERSLGEVVQ